MDIQYLLTLQGLRESLPSPIEMFFVLLSIIGDGPGLVAIVCVVYWCIDKRAGQFSFVALGVASFVSQLLKNIACVYRPWIRDAAIHPAAAALEGAGGYSFPSGHATGTAAAFGSFAWLARNRRRWLSIVCIIFVVLICFSRNFLGVHTPQDVLVGICIGLIMIAFAQLFFNWLDRWDALEPGHNKDILVAVVALALCAASIAIVVLKPYPMDYVNGELLVDPVAMQKGTFEMAGVLAGLAVAWVLERRFVGFSTDNLDMKTRVVRFIVGVGMVGITYIATDVIFKAVLPYNWAKLFALFVVVVVAVFIAPLVFGKFERKQGASVKGARPSARGTRRESVR